MGTPYHPDRGGGAEQQPLHLFASAPSVVERAVQATRHVGVARLTDVLAAARGADVEREVRVGLARLAGASFIDGDWFWFPDADRNRLVTLTRRMLAVCQPLALADTRGGLCRALPRRHAALVPPEDILEQFYDAHPAFASDTRGRVVSTEPLVAEIELPRSDRILVAVLRASLTGVLERGTLRVECAERGLSGAAFTAAVAHSVVLERPAPGLSSLRGTRISPVTVEALRSAGTFAFPPGSA